MSHYLHALPAICSGCYRLLHAIFASDVHLDHEFMIDLMKKSKELAKWESVKRPISKWIAQQFTLRPILSASLTSFPFGFDLWFLIA